MGKNGKFLIYLIFFLLLIIGSALIFISLDDKAIFREETQIWKKLDFNENKYAQFELENEKHSLVIESIQNDSIEITIQSDPIKLNLQLGESKKVDLNADNIYDLYVRFHSLVNGEPEIYIKEIIQEEEIIKGYVQEDPVTLGCIEDWACVEWEAEILEAENIYSCTETRTCKDLNLCGTEKDRPSEERECEINEKNFENQSKEASKENSYETPEESNEKCEICENCKAGYEFSLSESLTCIECLVSWVDDEQTYCNNGFICEDYKCVPEKCSKNSDCTNFCEGCIEEKQSCYHGRCINCDDFWGINCAEGYECSFGECESLTPIVEPDENENDCEICENCLSGKETYGYKTLNQADYDTKTCFECLSEWINGKNTYCKEGFICENYECIDSECTTDLDCQYCEGCIEGTQSCYHGRCVDCSFVGSIGCADGYQCHFGECIED
ncbi:MAG: hypothetical protein OQK82_05570 [Candidatus Pacearchaeota archaeon]|nr:hypothetical protein [Candidatus Pacearchaeota archaeon]